MPLATVREIALLKQLERFDHPNIVRLLDVWDAWFTLSDTPIFHTLTHSGRSLTPQGRNFVLL